MSKDLNIKSSTIEKGLELAKDFLDKLVMPAVEETGLLIKEKVTYWKFKNQVKILNKAKDYCEKHGIKPKTVSFKLLVPLIETSSLEEDELLQDKWAVLLGNLVDSDQNIENHVFPYILGQISTNEFLVLDKVVKDKKERIKTLKAELEQFLIDKPDIESDLKKKIAGIEEEIKLEQGDKIYSYSEKVWELRKKKTNLESQLRSLNYREGTYNWKINLQESIPEEGLREFEISNLSRLGLIRYIQENFADSQTLEIPNNPDDAYLTVDFDIEVDYEEKYLLTELGELFIEACSEKE
ncbi:MAG: Abi-alpha family protein [Bacteroidota bacterium]